MKNILLLLSILLFVSSCSFNSKPKEIDVKGKYKMNIPGFMISTNQLNDDASLQYQNPLKELYIIVIDDTFDDFSKAINSNEVESEYTNDFNGFVELISSGEGELFFTVADRSKMKDETINGLKAKTLENIRNITGVDIYYKAALIQGKDTYYQVIAWTLASRKDKHEKIITEMINSFTEI